MIEKENNKNNMVPKMGRRKSKICKSTATPE